MVRDAAYYNNQLVYSGISNKRLKVLYIIITPAVQIEFLNILNFLKSIIYTFYRACRSVVSCEYQFLCQYSINFNEYSIELKQE